MNIDWRDLLLKYMEHVGLNEGIDYTEDHFREEGYFTDEEWSTLQNLTETPQPNPPKTVSIVTIAPAGFEFPEYTYKVPVQPLRVSTEIKTDAEARMPQQLWHVDVVEVQQRG